MARKSLVGAAKIPNAKDAFIKEVPKKKPEVETKMLNTRVPKDLIKKVKIYCAEHETTVQEFITQTLEEKLNS
jgi:hypothetical protein